MIDIKIFERAAALIPEVQTPAAKPPLKSRLKWTALGLVLFFSLGVITPIGLAKTGQGGYIENLQMVMASKIGTIATLGIGPIVMGSIILQLLMGAGVISMDRSNPRDRQAFQTAQKVMALFFCFFEGAIYTLSGFIPANPGMQAIVLAQIAMGGIIIMYLDEIISKYGIGSGVGLFIAAGVSQTIVWHAFSFFDVGGGTFIGAVPQILAGLGTGTIPETALMALIFTLIVFLVVVYFESMKIEVPLTFGQIRGFGARYPLKFLYVSNIPVIFAAALFANVQLVGAAMDGVGAPWLGHFENGRATSEPLFCIGGTMVSQGKSVTCQGGFGVPGIAYFLTTPYRYLATSTDVAHTLADPLRILQIISFSAAMMIMCVIFGRIWVELSGMSSKDVAGQLQHVGLHVPGFRRDPRIIERVLDRYIPTITVLGAMAVGLLAVFADLTGAIGTGTGILLTVGILYRLYEELASDQAMEMMPALKKFMS